MRFDVKDRNTEKLTRQMDVLIGEVRKLNTTLEKYIRQDTQQGEQVMASMEDLQAEVAQNTDVTQSAVAVINGIAQQLRDALAANDPAAIQAVVDQLDQNSSALAAAVTENTPHVEHR